MTDLDEQLQTLAISDWKSFIELIGEDALLNAKVCLLRREKKSYGAICQRLKLTKRQVQNRSPKCNCKEV